MSQSGVSQILFVDCLDDSLNILSLKRKRREHTVLLRLRVRLQSATVLQKVNVAAATRLRVAGADLPSQIRPTFGECIVRCKGRMPDRVQCSLPA